MQFFKVSLVCRVVGVLRAKLQESYSVSHVVGVLYVAVHEVGIPVLFVVWNLVNPKLLSGERTNVDEYFVFLQLYTVVD